MKVLRASVPLFAFWLVLTGSLKSFDLVIGLVLSALLGWWAAVALWPTDDDPSLTPTRAVRFVFYVPWLIKEILVAATGVAEIVLRPRMPIDPLVIVYHSPVQSAVSRVAFANSITLTPGTLTVDLEGSNYTVHCLNKEFARGVEAGDMDRRIHRVFEE
ncbi:MAG: Na+/H+ antiporter subunit E [Actinomycetota bacterium]|nr:MAG: multicomponent Na+H+ antiporter subunit [Actinomycetota bacterium]MDO8949224.1 Na+/H+ antiporter subunit E [Actinomycetota bacterium]MDP3631447.1 Na+/H+ antiporter subunit E [Actinomycetota bacterium]